MKHRRYSDCVEINSDTNYLSVFFHNVVRITTLSSNLTLGFYHCDVIILRVTGPLWGENTGGFPSQRPVTWSYDAFFDLRLNKWLSKQSRHRDAGDLRRHRAHYDIIVSIIDVRDVCCCWVTFYNKGKSSYISHMSKDMCLHFVVYCCG